MKRKKQTPPTPPEPPTEESEATVAHGLAVLEQARRELAELRKRQNQ